MTKKIERLEDLTPDSENFNKHTEFGSKLLEDSLRKFGAGRSVLVDKDGNLIAGNGVVETAEAIGMEDVIVVPSDGKKLVVVQRTDLSLDSPEGRELALADNMTALKGIDLDLAKVQETLGEDLAKAWGMEITPPQLPDDEAEIKRKEAEFRQRMEAGENLSEDEEYLEFLEKFKAKKTTDDCYTPDIVYNAVAKWVEDEYHVNRKDFVRPFYPGGDYKAERYPEGCIVVDNPPFSILAEILNFYKEQGIRFFLFAPTLTLFSSSSSSSCALPCGASVTYENGASVSTSFITNLEDKTIRFKSCPSLYQAVQAAADEYTKSITKELPKYTYPDNVVTAAFVARLSRYGIDFKVEVSRSCAISSLESQKESGKAIYGKGYLISSKAAAEKAAAEKAAATRWQLSQREKEIIEKLSKNE